MLRALMGGAGTGGMPGPVPAARSVGAILCLPEDYTDSACNTVTNGGNPEFWMIPTRNKYRRYYGSSVAEPVEN